MSEPTPWVKRSWFRRLLCDFGLHEWAAYSVPLRPMSDLQVAGPFVRYTPPDGTSRECYCGYFEKYDRDLGWHTYSDNG